MFPIASWMLRVLLRGRRQRIARLRRRNIAGIERFEDRTLLNAVSYYGTFNNTDWMSVGAGGIPRYSPANATRGPITGDATLNVDLPDGSTRYLSLLVWQGIDLTSQGGDGVYDNGQVTVNGTTFTGAPWGVNDTANWGSGGSQTFVANVSDAVTGTGTYQIGNLSAKPGHQANGVSLFVLYLDGDESNNRVVNLYFGNQNRDQQIWGDEIYYRGGDMKIQLHAADGQGFGDAGLEFQLFDPFGTSVGTQTIPDTTSLLDGNSVPSMGFKRDQLSAFWDIHNFNITSAFADDPPPVGYEYLVQMRQLPGANDLVKWVAFAVDQPWDGSLTPNGIPVAEDVAVTTNEDVSWNAMFDVTDPDGDPIVLYEIEAQPAHGTARAWNEDGALAPVFSYTPALNFHGTDSFRYRAFDGQNWSAYATVTVTVNPVNDAPVMSAQTFSGFEDTVLNGQLVANDVDGDSLTYSNVTQPQNGTLAFNADGSFSFTPNQDYHGTVQFTARVSDGSLSVDRTITLSLASINDAPIAFPSNFTAAEETNTNGFVSGLDFDGDVLTYTLVSSVSHGSLGFNANGTFTYRSAVNYNGPDSFTFTVSDGQSTSRVETVSITVTPVNDRPLANASSFTIAEDTSHSGNVTASDVEGDPLTYSLYSSPSFGTLTFLTDGSYTYTPRANWYGTDSFMFRAFDGGLFSFQVPVSITVTAVNDAPTANDDVFTVAEDGVLDLVLPVSEFSFVSEPGEYVGAGQTLSYDRSNSTISVLRNSINSYVGFSVFTPNISDYWMVDFAAPNATPLAVGTYTGATRYPFQAAGVPGLSVTGQHRGYNTSVGEFTVTQANYAADGTVLSFAAEFWQAGYVGAPKMTGQIKYNYVDGSGTTGSVVWNDTDVETRILTPVLVDGPAHGQLNLRSDGTFSYIPDPDFNGVDTFTYRASDGVLQSNLATVTINVTPVQDGPTADDAALTTDEDTVLNGQLTGGDVDGEALTYVLNAGPAHGTLSLNANGSYVYTPNANFHGSDSFTFHVNDGTANSAVATVSLTVNSVNDAPTANGASASTDEDTVLNGQLTGGDVDGDALTYVLNAGPAHGTLSLNANGSFVYTPNANFHGSDSFTFHVNDGAADSGVATISLTVNSVNDAPTGIWSGGSVAENSPVGTAVGTVAGADIDGDALTYAIVSGNGAGAFAINAVTGAITVSASGPLDYETTPFFSLVVRVSDGNGLSVDLPAEIALTDVDEVLTARIDAIPNSSSNVLNIADSSTIDIAIDSTASLDVRTINVESLVLTVDGVVFTINRNRRGVPKVSSVDTNGDGIVDRLIVTFNVNKTGLTDGSASVVLTGLAGGRAFEGTDTVMIQTTSSKGGKGGGKK